MDDAVRDRLSDLIRAHGVDLLQDPTRLEAFLRDVCPGSRAEIYCVVTSVREGTVNELKDGGGGFSAEAARDRAAQRLSRDLRFDGEAARWTVDTLVAALEAASVPVADDLDRVGYCASCHTMTIAGADRESCSACGAALIDVRLITRDEREEPTTAPDSEAPLQVDVTPGPALSSGVPRLGVAAAQSPLETVAATKRPDEAPATTTEARSLSAASGGTVPGPNRPANAAKRPHRQRVGRRYRAILIIAVIAAIAGAVLAVVSLSRPSAYTYDEMRTTFEINSLAYAVGSTRAWAVGDNGVILTSVDDGTTWTRQDSGIGDDLVTVFAFSWSDCNAIADDGTTFTTSDGGATWD